MLGNDNLNDYRELLADFQLFLVGVEGSLEEAEGTERQRDDRMVGMARWQASRVHQGVEYDLVVDMSHSSPENCAHRIKSVIRL